MRGRWRAAALVAILAGCGGATSSSTEDTDPSGGGGQPDDGPPTPNFIDPATQHVELITRYTKEVTFRVKGVLVGITQVLLDGTSVGVALEGAYPDLWLNDYALYLDLAGGMVEGVHHIRLINDDDDAPRTSTLVEVVLLQSAGEDPVLTVSIDPPLPLSVDALVVAGGGGGLLGALDRQAGVLAILRSWSPDQVATLSLEGLALAGDGGPPEVALLALDVGEDGEAGAARVAWRVGDPGVALATAEVAWDGSTATEPALVAELAGPLAVPVDEPLEWRGFGRPAFVGDTLVSEFHAVIDAELAHPGDRRIAFVRWRDDGPEAPRLFVTGDAIDLDALGPALVIPDAHTRALGVRVGGVSPGVLREGPLGLTLERGLQHARTGVGVAAPASTATILSHLGSWTLATLTAGGELALSFQNTSSQAVEPAEVAWASAALVGAADDALPEGVAPTGPIAPALLGGEPVFLVPYGDAADVRAVISTGRRPIVAALELRCDVVAAPLDFSANVVLGGDEPVQRFACVRDGAVALGQLTLVR